MKKYKYSYSKLIIGLFILGIVIAVACIALNLYRFVLKIRGEYEITGYDWFMLILVILLSIAFIVIAISCFVSSNYVVENKAVVLNWGIIKNKLDLIDVTTLKYYPDKNRVELIFSDESYFYIATKPEWVNDFISDIKTANSKILYIEETSLSDN